MGSHGPSGTWHKYAENCKTRGRDMLLESGIGTLPASSGGACWELMATLVEAQDENILWPHQVEVHAWNSLRPHQLKWMHMGLK